MYLNFKIALMSLFLFFIAQKIVAQPLITADSLYKKNSSIFLTSYNKILNIHNFSSNLYSDYSLDGLTLRLSNRFNSNVIVATTKNIRDENYFDLSMGYDFTKFFQPKISVESKRINDDRKVGISRFKDFAIKGWVTSNPFLSFSLSPFYGFKSEEQFELYEKGYTYGLFTMLDEKLQNSRITGSAHFQNDKLRIRSNFFILSELSFENSFSEFFFSHTKFNFNKIRRDYFTPIDSLTSKLFNINHNIETRIDNFIDFTQQLKLFEKSESRIILTGNFFYRTVEKTLRYRNYSQPSKNIFDSEINEFKFNLSGESNIHFGKINSNIKIIYSERSEKHSINQIPTIPEFYYFTRLDEEIQKNNFTSRVVISGETDFHVFSRDTISFEGSISKLKYDTPSLDNYYNPSTISRDDRDELLFVLRLQYYKHFNSYLSTNILLESFNNHLIYIFKEKSSNNNWNRVVRLATQTDYNGEWIISKNHFEVLANYTVYDFEHKFQGLQSFVFRQFGFQDSTKILISRNTFLSIVYNLKLSEQGTFNLRRFTSLPARFLNEQTGELIFGKSLSPISTIAFGIRSTYFGEFNFNGNEKNIQFEMKSIGPILEAKLYKSTNFYLNLKCWIEYIKQLNQSSRRNVNLSFNSHLTL